MGRDIGELIRCADPRELSSQERRETIAAAVLAGRARHRARFRRQMMGAGAIMAAAAALFVFGRGLLSSGEGDEMTRLALASGDRLTAVQETDFEVFADTAEGRRVNLHRGAMLFDIAHLEQGQHFRVETPGARIDVVGTIFSVEVSERGTSVVVYEGRVDVHEDGRASVLRAGQRYRADRASRRSERLAPIGRRAAIERTEGVLAAAAVEASAVGESVESAVGESVESAAGAAGAEEAEAAASDAEPTPGDRGGGLPGGSAGTRESDFAAERASGQASRTHSARSARFVARERSETRNREPSSTSAAPPMTSGATTSTDDARSPDDYEAEAREFDRAAGGLTGSARAVAGTRAAMIYWRNLHRASAALASLVASDALESENPLRERALAMQAEALLSLGRWVAGELAVRRYLEEFPNGPRAIWMRVQLRRHASSHIVPSGTE